MTTALYLLALLALAIYSYSQIDLNLTLLQHPAFINFQNVMIQLGYFNRPSSTLIYLIIIFLLFVFYIRILAKAGRDHLSSRQLALPILGVVILGLISYPAFSHDFFNYLFDIRILTHYNLNPYQFRPLDFPADPWLRFMHWVHRPYPYGPFWLVLTFLPSVFGFGKFVLTLLNFKILFLTFYLGSIFLIKKILTRISPQKIALGVVFFALNPLVIVEAVVSPHLDIVMAFFLLLSTYLLLSTKRVLAILSLVLSAGVKFLTIVLLPVYFFRLPYDRTIKILVVLLLLSLVPVIYQREFYPWYFLPIFSLLALLAPQGKLLILSLSASAGLLLSYAPYLYVGSYPPEVQQAKLIVTFLPLALGLTIYGRKIFLQN